MTIETNITNRRELASALAQYMNTHAVYLGPPTFAYQIGDIHLSREGILSGNDLDGIFPFLEMQGIITTQSKMIQEPAENTAPSIQIPLEGYTPVNLRNLFSMAAKSDTARMSTAARSGAATTSMMAIRSARHRM